MPVVINEFEVVADQQEAHRGNGAGADKPADASTPAPLDPSALTKVLRTLDRQALRVWAH
jgi:hypothetical protein